MDGKTQYPKDTRCPDLPHVFIQENAPLQSPQGLHLVLVTPNKLLLTCVLLSAGQGRTRLKNKMGVLLPWYKLRQKQGQRSR